MSSKNWKDAVEKIRAASPSAPSKVQEQLAGIAGIAFSSRIPALVAAARLRYGLREALAINTQSWAPSDAQLDLINRLASDMGQVPPAVSSIDEYATCTTCYSTCTTCTLLQLGSDHVR